MAWCKTNVSDFYLVTFFLQKCLNFCNLVVKHSPVFFLAVLHFRNEACTMNAVRWNKRILAPLLVSIDVVQVIKARVHGG